jgi:hypothetical protein
MGLDELLVVVVILSMALTPLSVDLALKIAGDDFMSTLQSEDEDAIDVAAGVEKNMEALDLRTLGNSSIDLASMDEEELRADR